MLPPKKKAEYRNVAEYLGTFGGSRKEALDYFELPDTYESTVGLWANLGLMRCLHSVAVANGVRLALGSALDPSFFLELARNPEEAAEMAYRLHTARREKEILSSGRRR